MLDHYLQGECNRISPEAPVPVVNVKNEESRLGGAANVANNVATLGANCTLIGVYGNDDYAMQLDLLLSNNSLISNKLYKSSGRPTIVKTRVLVGGHQMIRLDRESTCLMDKYEEKEVLKIFFDEIEQANIVLVSDYSKGVLSKNLLQTIFQTSKELNIPTIVDPKSVDFSIYKGATFIKPNRKEAEIATGIKIFDSNSLEISSKVIAEITETEAVITTLSEDGVGLFSNNYLQIIPTKAQKVFDVTGAGDTYLAAFAYEYLLTHDVFAACEFANFAAGVVVAKIGSSTASLKEINKIQTGINCYES